MPKTKKPAKRQVKKTNSGKKQINKGKISKSLSVRVVRKKISKKSEQLKRNRNKKKIIIYGLSLLVLSLLIYVLLFAFSSNLGVENNQESKKSVLGTSTPEEIYKIGQYLDMDIRKASFFRAKMFPITWKSSNQNVVQVQVSKYDSRVARLYFINSGEAIVSSDYSGYPQKKVIVGHEKEPLSGYDNSQSVELRGVSIIVEKGCDSNIINKYKEYFKIIPDYLINYKQIRFLYGDSIPGYRGFATGNYSIGLRCNEFEPYALLHESAHTIDLSYNNANKRMYISEQPDFRKLFLKYIGLKSEGEKYFFDSEDGNYQYFHDYWHSNSREFFAEIYVAYFHRYILSVDNIYFNTSYSFPQDVKDMLRKYIPKLDTETPTRSATSPVNPGKITYAKWYNKNSKEARLIGSEVAQVKFMSDTLQDGYTMTCYNNNGASILDIPLPNKYNSGDTYRYSNDYYTYINRKCYVGGYKWNAAAGKNLWGTAKEITN